MQETIEASTTTSTTTSPTTRTTTTLDPKPYIAAYAKTHGSPQSISAVRLWVPMFTDFINARPDGLTAPALQGFREYLGDEGYKPSSINRAIGAVRGYLKHLRIRGAMPIDSELVSLALPPAKLHTMMPVVLTRDEIQRLCEYAGLFGNAPTGLMNVPVATFLALGLLTGMRPGEILRCSPTHHQPARGLMVYATKTGRERCIPLSDNTELAMLLSGAGSGMTPYCAGFSTRGFDDLCRAALGRTINRKVLRSTHSSYVASSGKVSEFMYCARLGHTLEVANAHYRSPIQGVTGDTVAEWFGCADAIRSLVQRICQ